MILPFSTIINKKPSYFVERIHKGIREVLNLGVPYKTKEFSYQFYMDCAPKLHTIREDKKDRWKVDIKIDFFINVRQKNMFRFAPVLPVVSVQDVLMTYYHSDVIQISIDDRELFSHTERLEFAQNDGFDTWEDFFNYFYPKIKENPNHFYKGKLIHWTNKKY